MPRLTPLLLLLVRTAQCGARGTERARASRAHASSSHATSAQSAAGASNADADAKRSKPSPGPASQGPASQGESRARECCHLLRGAPKTGTTWTTEILEKIAALACEEGPSEEPARAGRGAGCRACAKCDGDSGKHSNGFDAGIYAGAASKRSDVRFISTYRDPRDVAVSMYHWSGVYKSEFRSTTASEYAIRKGCREATRRANAQIAAENGKGPNARVLRVFYEATKADPVGVIMIVARFIGHPIRQEQAVSVANATSFESMRREEASGEMHLKVHPDSAAKLQKPTDPTMLNGVMTRSGIAGNFMQELNATAQRACVREMKRLRPMLASRYMPVYEADAAFDFLPKP